MYYITKRFELAGCHRLELSYFNELLPFNPTAENIARWICEQIPHCYRVDVQESEGNTASYTSIDD
ncbi:MAG: hypothetical protein HFJ95_07500 [Muribaculaceae bacterium]|nr:hypothetical protein [Muribaculaceae bacterium]